MAASYTIIDTATAIVVDTTRTITNNPGGGHSSSLFYFDCTAIGTVSDTWQISLYWVAPSGNKILVAQSATFTTTGLKPIVLQAPFTSTNVAVPQPNQIIYDNTAGTTQTLTGTLWAGYGD